MFCKPDHIAKNIIVALDFDGCIAFGAAVKIKYAKILHHVDITLEQTQSSTYPLGKEAYRKLADVTGAVPCIYEFELAPHVKEVLLTLYREGFRFAVITSRPNYQFEDCKRCCAHYGLPIKYFNNMNDQGDSISKAGFCERLHARAIIDDTYKKLAMFENVPLE